MERPADFDPSIGTDEPRIDERVTVSLVALGGALGATARWGVAELVGPTPEITPAFPWSTLIVNVVGCFLIGAAAVRLSDSSPARPFLITGVLGGFTTMSALAVELNDHADAGQTLDAGIYLAVTLVAGLVAVVGGELLARLRESPS